ncbi:actin cytoskeleton and mitosis protein [Polyrhizophydium stewartii]|uniref:Actin cytoskeleton and mitosis protein n=1 Tax=Polyrhizophydium stewartii TaxID=2732419 RepID=A0ABR4N266_9FUNG
MSAFTQPRPRTATAPLQGARPPQQRGFSFSGTAPSTGWGPGRPPFRNMSLKNTGAGRAPASVSFLGAQEIDMDMTDPDDEMGGYGGPADPGFQENGFVKSPFSLAPEMPRADPAAAVQQPAFRGSVQAAGKRGASDALADMAPSRPAASLRTLVSVNPSTTTTKSDRDERFAVKSSGANRYMELKAQRDALQQKYIAEGKMADPDARYDLDNAPKFVAECMDMCPEFERHEREFERGLDRFEKLADAPDGEYRADHARVVKRFQRSAAGRAVTLPCDVRPPHVLQMTLDYLVHEIVAKHGIEESYAFVRDRARAIRNDLTLQNYNGPEAVELHERIARYHILCSYLLCENSSVSMQQEHEQLRKTLQSLLEYYKEMARQGVEMPNEPEFQAYYILTHAWSNEHVSRCERELSERVFMDERVQLALRLRFLMARTNQDKIAGRPSTEGSINNFVAFFRAIQHPDVPFLAACCLHMEFVDVRMGAVKTMCRAYHLFDSKSMWFPVDDVVDMLALDDPDEAVELLGHYGVPVEQSDGVWVAGIGKLQGSKARPQIDESKIKLAMRRSFKLVDCKRNSLSDVDIIDAPFVPSPQQQSTASLQGSAAVAATISKQGGFGLPENPATSATPPAIQQLELVKHEIVDDLVEAIAIEVATETLSHSRLIATTSDDVVEDVVDELIGQVVGELTVERVKAELDLVAFRSAMESAYEDLCDEVMAEVAEEVIFEIADELRRVAELEAFGWQRWRFVCLRERLRRQRAAQRHAYFYEHMTATIAAPVGRASVGASVRLAGEPRLAPRADGAALHARLMEMAKQASERQAAWRSPLDVGPALGAGLAEQLQARPTRSAFFKLVLSVAQSGSSFDAAGRRAFEGRSNLTRLAEEWLLSKLGARDAEKAPVLGSLSGDESVSSSVREVSRRVVAVAPATSAQPARHAHDVHVLVETFTSQLGSRSSIPRSQNHNAEAVLSGVNAAVFQLAWLDDATKVSEYWARQARLVQEFVMALPDRSCVPLLVVYWPNDRLAAQRLDGAQMLHMLGLAAMQHRGAVGNVQILALAASAQHFDNEQASRQLLDALRGLASGCALAPQFRFEPLQELVAPRLSAFLQHAASHIEDVLPRAARVHPFVFVPAARVFGEIYNLFVDALVGIVADEALQEIPLPARGFGDLEYELSVSWNAPEALERLRQLGGASEIGPIDIDVDYSAAGFDQAVEFFERLADRVASAALDACDRFGVGLMPPGTSVRALVRDHLGGGAGPLPLALILLHMATLAFTPLSSALEASRVPYVVDAVDDRVHQFSVRAREALATWVGGLDLSASLAQSAVPSPLPADLELNGGDAWDGEAHGYHDVAARLDSAVPRTPGVHERWPTDTGESVAGSEDDQLDRKRWIERTLSPSSRKARKVSEDSAATAATQSDGVRVLSDQLRAIMQQAQQSALEAQQLLEAVRE